MKLKIHVRYFFVTAINCIHTNNYCKKFASFTVDLIFSNNIHEQWFELMILVCYRTLPQNVTYFL